MVALNRCKSCGSPKIQDGRSGGIYYFCLTCMVPSHSAEDVQEAREMWNYDNPIPPEPDRESYGSW